MRTPSAIAMLGFCVVASITSQAAELADPPMLPAHDAPDFLMVARPQLLPFTGQPEGYAYEICARPNDSAARRCPVPGRIVDLHTCPTASDPAVSPYGGVRLQVTPGQILRIRLVNCLPPTIDAKHAEGDALLQSNPTNLHTHGLIVEPRRADNAKDPFGDYVFVLDLPPGTRPPASMPGMPIHSTDDHARNFDYREQVVEYAIPIPSNHPAGLFWFHPHVHGLSLNQVTGGLAGIITVGDVHSYTCDHGATCAPGQLRPHVRHLVLKDTQLTSNFRVRFQENPAMCATPDAIGNLGGCAGIGKNFGTPTEDDDGRWEFTVNGQTYPDIAIHPAGEIWRIANASASASYNVGLFPLGVGAAPLVFQVLAIDGVSLVLPPGLTADQASKLLGDKLTVVACPGAPAGSLPTQPVCTTSLRMMPSARTEIFVRGDAAQGQAALRTVHRQTGPRENGPPVGDDWPSIDLARLTFPVPVVTPAAVAAGAPATLSVIPTAVRAFASGGVFSGPVTTRLDAAAPPIPVATLWPPAGASLSPAQQARAKALQPADSLDCTPLPSGKIRQVLFGIPANQDHFGLGYRLIAAGDTNPPAVADAPKIVEFDHAAPPTVCVQLGRENQKVTETWMLVNLAGEDHNFHMHQTRFSVVATPVGGDTTLPPLVNDQPVLLDNVPLPHATGDACDGTIGPWIAGTCKPTFVTVSIPFQEVGDFVYHCHILEHEDGGMMAKITVVPHRS